MRLCGGQWPDLTPPASRSGPHARRSVGLGVTAPGAYAPTRPELLVMARERLAAELRTGGHLPACGCECGKAANASALAAVSRELRAVMSEIEALPRPENTSASGSLAARVASARTSGALAPADHA